MRLEAGYHIKVLAPRCPSLRVSLHLCAPPTGVSLEGGVYAADGIVERLLRLRGRVREEIR